jgi:hypothetical protein
MAFIEIFRALVHSFIHSFIHSLIHSFKLAITICKQDGGALRVHFRDVVPNCAQIIPSLAARDEHRDLFSSEQ